MDDILIYLFGCVTGVVVWAAAMAMLPEAGRADDRIENWDQRKTVVNKSRIEG